MIKVNNFENLSLSELEELKKNITAQIRNAENDQKQLLIGQAKEISDKIKSINPKITKKISQQPQKNNDLIEVICEQCEQIYKSSNKNRVPVVYCKKCRKIRQNDLIEIICRDSNQTFFLNSESEAEIYLKKFCKANIRLDLHKTLDTISSSTKLPTDSACCVSYVGALTITRSEARSEIKQRINTGQIRFGVLVFKRGSSRNPEEANRFTDPGSKAWFNNILPADDDDNCGVLFVDDSEDHVNSVQSIGIPSILIKPGENLLKLINK